MDTDFENIHRIINDYCWYADTRDVDAIVGLFALDGVMNAEPAGLGVFEGRDALLKFYGDLLPQHEYSQHIAGNHRIDIDGDEAAGTSYYLMQGAIKGAGPISAGGYFEDRFVRSADGWRIAFRRGVPLIPFNLGAMTNSQDGTAHARQ